MGENMSWDIYLRGERHTCPTCGHTPEDDGSDGMNYTSNTVPMLHAAAVGSGWIEDGKWIGEAIQGARMTGAEFATRMDKCFEWWSNNEPAMRALNPSNGWGDFDRYRDFWRKFVALCRKYPNHIVELSR